MLTRSGVPAEEMPEGVMVEAGQVREGSVDYGYQAYVLEAAAGEVLSLWAQRTSGNLNPRVEILRPDGSELIGGGTTVNDGYLVLPEIRIDQTGRHVILVSDYQGYRSGVYRLTFRAQGVEPQADEVVLEPYVPIVAEITEVGEADYYVFAAEAGEVVSLNLGDNGDLYGWMEVYGPDGRRLAQAGGSSRESLRVGALEQSGWHRVVVRDDNGLQGGSYRLLLTRSGVPAGEMPEGVMVEAGQVREGSVDYGYQAYVLEAAAGEVLSLWAQRTGGDLNPHLEVLRPDGSELIRGGTTVNDGYLVLPEIRIDQDGQQVILVSDYQGYRTGGYTLGIEQAEVPQIIAQPESREVILLTDVILTVGVTGSEPFSYQWQFNGEDILDATEPSLDLGAFSEEMAGTYSVIVNNAVGSITSGNAVLTLVEAPVILEHPVSQDVALGDELLLETQATGTEPLEYQWRRNGNDIPGAEEKVLSIEEFQPSDGGTFTVVVRNPYGIAESEPATIRPVSPVLPVADFFTDRVFLGEVSGVGVSSNRNATREPGEPVHAGKNGGKSLWLSWQSERSGIVEISTDGSGFDTLLAVYLGTSLTGLTEVDSNEDHNGLLTSRLRFHSNRDIAYSIVIDGFDGASGDLVVQWAFEPDEVPIPIIISQSQHQVVREGESIVLEVLAEGLGLGLQWFKNGEILPAETKAILPIAEFGIDDVGIYEVVAQDQLGRSVTSRPIRLEMGENDHALAVTKLADLWASPGASGVQIAAAFPTPGFTSVSAGVVAHEIMSNANAIREPGENNHCGDQDATGGSIWYGLIPKESGILFLDTDGSEIQTVIALYLGRSHQSQTLLACSDFSTDLAGFPRVALQVEEGLEYAVAIVGRNRMQGLIDLNWVLIPEGHQVLGLEMMTEGFEFYESVPANVVLELQRSQNMRSWQKIHRGRRKSGILRFLDRDVLKKERWFYRVVEPKQ